MTTRRRLLSALRVAFVAGCVLGCVIGCVADGPGAGTGQAGVDDTDAPPRVAVPIEPYAWLVRQLDPDTEVAVLVAPGETPETFQPTDAETARLLRSRVYFRAGVPFERGGWLAALERSSALRVVDLRDGIELRAIEGHALGHAHGPGHDHGEPGAGGAADSADPHLWLAPRILAAQGRRVAEVLSDAFPTRSAIHRQRLAGLEDRLDALDRELATRLAPHRGRSFVVFHPSWGYFADAYGLRQLAVEIAGQTPSDAEIQALRRALDAEGRGPRTIFVAPQLAGPTARAVADALGAELVTLDPLAADVPEALRAAAEALARSFGDGPAPA